MTTKPDKEALIERPPGLPGHVSSDGREIWAWAADLSAWRHRQDRIATLEADIRRRARECGSCDHWMKSRICPRETHANGRPRGPSMSAPICSKYVMSATDAKLQTERKDELAALRTQTQGANQ